MTLINCGFPAPTPFFIILFPVAFGNACRGSVVKMFYRLKNNMFGKS